jgi:hypothetical protein
VFCHCFKGATSSFHMLYKTDGICKWGHHIYFCVLLLQCQRCILYFLYWTSICDENLNRNLRFSWFFGLLVSSFRQEDCSECFRPYKSTWMFFCYYSLFDQQGYYKTTLNGKENSIQAWRIHSKEYQLIWKVLDSVTLYGHRN